MKTAEEWLYELDANETGVAVCTTSEIRQIQLDALKQGMTEAAEIVHDEGLLQMSESILAARDSKTSL